MARTLVVEISGKRPGGKKARPTEYFDIEYDHLIISNNSDGYDTDWKIINVPEDYVEWYKANVRNSNTAWYAPMNRSYAIKYAKENGYDYLFQLDDNIRMLEILYELDDGKIKRKYRHIGIEMANDYIRFMELVLSKTNAAMVGLQLAGSARPSPCFIGERYTYSFFGLNLKTCPDIFHGDFEDDIEFRLKCAEMGTPVLQIYPMRYGKTGQKSNKDETGNRAAYTIAGIDRGKNMRKIHGDVYSAGYSFKTAATNSRDCGKFFKHKLKPVKSGTLVADWEGICDGFRELLAKYAEPKPERVFVKQIRRKKNGKTKKRDKSASV